jgi:hypothetical protein
MSGDAGSTQPVQEDTKANPRARRTVERGWCSAGIRDADAPYWLAVIPPST